MPTSQIANLFGAVAVLMLITEPDTTFDIVPARCDEHEQFYLVQILQGHTPRWKDLPSGMFPGQHHQHVKARNRACERASVEYVHDGDWQVVEAFAAFHY